MSNLKHYDVTVNGHKTTLKLTEDQARARGLKAAEPPKNKARSSTSNRRRSPAKKAAQPPAPTPEAPKDPPAGDGDGASTENDN